MINLYNIFRHCKYNPVVYGLVLILSLFTSRVSSQTITINNTQFVTTSSYGVGGGITVPVKLDGCFALNNQFELYLSDASGNFSPGVKIGSYSGFFTQFLNGIIPSGTSAGSNYKVKVVATSPSVSVISPAITISSTGVVPVSNLVTSPSNTINDSTYGRCLITTNQSITLQETVPAGYTFSAKVLDSLGNPIAATITATQVQFTMIPGSYYTIQAQLLKNSDNSISNRSFLVMASTNNLSLQTSGANDVCLPDIKGYTINVTGNGGIKSNYPGTRYTIEWGDGTIDTYTHCELINRNGELLHNYTSTSCGRPPITDLTPAQNNAFRVNVKAANDLCPNSFTTLTTYSKVWQKPNADFINPGFACINTPVTIINTTNPGLSGYNNVVNCIDTAMYEWYIDGNLIFNAPKDITYTFTTTGNHTIRLVAINEPCSDEISKVICIEEPVVPSFNLNGLDSISGCAPLTVNVSNLTTSTNSFNCRPYNGKWEVLISPSFAPAILGVHYTISPSDSAENPQIVFLFPGKYVVRLSVGNSCGVSSKDLNVTITDAAGVILPLPARRYCGLRTINFATDNGHVPTYNTNSGSYNWTVSGGSYTFVGGTNSTSQYPQIQFNNFSVYNLTVQFNNACGTQTATQTITFDSAVTATASNDTTVCNNVNSVQLTGSSTGTTSSATWSIVNGSGSFSDAAIPNPLYNFSPADKVNGSVTLRYSASPVAGSVCAVATDDVTITILAKNTIISAATKTICSAGNVNYTPVSALPSSSFNWTSTVVSGSVTGNSAGGTGSINDVLTNLSTSANAVVKYTITPVSVACDGEAFDLLVTVIPTPDLTVTVPVDTLCTGSQSNIQLSSSYSATHFKWTTTLVSGSLTGYSNQLTPIATNAINQTLINTGSTYAVIEYTITAVGDSTLECPGETKTVTLVIRPGATIANAGNDQLLCNQTTTNLQGNAPVVGTGFWVQVAGAATTIANPALYNSAITGLQPNSSYTYVWTINNSSGCPSTNDTLKITNRPSTTVANAGGNIVICNFNNATDSVQLSANSLTYPAFETGLWSIATPIPAGSNPIILDSSNPASYFIFDKVGIYKLVWTITNDAGCAPSIDTVVITVFNQPVTGSIAPLDTAICKGETVTFSSTPVNGTILKWQYNIAPLTDNIWIDTLITATSIAFNNIQDTTAVRVIVQSNGYLLGCNVTDTSDVAIVIVHPASDGGLTSISDTVCKGNNGGIIMVSGFVGAIVRWEYSTNNGTSWTSISDTTSSITYTNLTTTTWYRALVQSGTCASAYSDTTIITVLDEVTPAVAGPDQLVCGTSVQLSGNTPATNETGTWSQLSGPNTSTLSSSLTSLTASGLIPGVYQFVWKLSNAGCPSTTDTVQVIVRPDVTPANAGADVVVCDFDTSASVTLNANSPLAFEAGQWTILSQPTGGNGSFSNASNPAASFSFNASGKYQLVWTITNDAGCTPTKDTVEINVFGKPSIGTISGPTAVCAAQDVAVTLNTFSGVIKKWQYNIAPLDDNIWIDTLVTASSINFLNVTNTFAVRVIVASTGAAYGCNTTDTSNILIVNVAPPTVPGTLGSDATVCKAANNGTITLTGNTGRIVRWEYSTNNGTSWTSISDTTSSITYTNLTTTTWYRALVQSGTCASAYSDTTIITVLDEVTPAVAGPDQLVCGTSVQLSGSTPATNETGTWSQVSGPNTATLSSSLTSLTVSGLIPGVYQFVWKLSNAGCPSTTDTVQVIVRPDVTPANAGADVVVCDFDTSASVTLNANSTLAFEAGQWTILSQPTGGNGSFSNASNPAASFSFNASGKYQLVWTITNDAGCTPTKDTVEINVYGKPSIGTISGPTSVCAGQDVAVTLNTFSGVIKKWQYNIAPLDDNIWIDTLVIASSINFLNVTNTFAVRVIVASTGAAYGCNTTDTSNILIINVAPPTVPGTLGSDATVCKAANNATITLTGNTGSVVRWEYSTNNGTSWTSISDTTSSITYTNLTTTTWYRALVQSGTCSSAYSDTTIITVLDEVTPAVAGPDQLVCGTSVQLSGSTPATNETGTWSQVSGPNTATLSSSLTSLTVSGLIPGVYQFVWKLSNAGCPSTTDTVQVIVRPDVTPANAGADVVVCDFDTSASVTLNANSTLAFEAGQWTILSQPTGGNGSFSNASNPAASFSFNASGKYQLVWTITNDAGCTPTKDTVEINVYGKPSIGTISGPTSVCAGQDVAVTLNTFSGVIKKWQYNIAPLDDNIWIDTLVIASSINFLNVTNTFAVRVIVASTGAAYGCNTTDTSNILIINVAPPTVPGTLGSDATVCKAANNATITLTGNTGSVVRWEYSTNNGTSWTSISDTTSSITYTNLTTTTWYRALVQSGTCSSAYSDTTIITVLDEVTPAVAGPDQLVCGTSVQLSGSTPATNETGTWSQVSGPNTATLSSSLTSLTASGLIPGVYQFVWKLSNAGCPSTTDTVQVIVRPDVTPANAGADVVVCDFDTTASVTLNANSPLAFEAGQWTILSQPTGGNGSFSNASNPAASFSFNASGKYQLVWTITNDAGCTPTKDTVEINVYGKPSIGTISGPTSVCAAQDVAVTLNTFSGVILKWQYNPAPIADNIWIDTLVTASNINFLNVTNTFAVRVIVASTGAAYGCNTTDTSNVLIVNVAPPTVPGTLTSDAIVCKAANNGTITLTGNTGTIVRWEYSTNNGTSWTSISDTTSSITYTNLTTTTWYRALVQSGTCASAYSDTTIITLLDEVTPAVAGPDQSLCNVTTVSLNANAAGTSETGTWSQIAGVPVTFSAVNNPALSIINIQPGTYTFVWTISNNTCPSTSDTVSVVIYPELINIIDSSSRNLCYGQSVTVAGQPSTGGNGVYNYQWQESSDGINWVNLTGQKSQNLTLIPTGNVYVRRLVNSLPCAAISQQAFISVLTPITNNTIASDQVICINTSAATLTGSLPGGASGTYTYQWHQSIDSGKTWLDITNATTQNYNPGVLLVTTMYKRTVTSDLCTGKQGSVSDSVTITVNPNAIAEFTYSKDTSCPLFIIDTSIIKTTTYDQQNISFQWYANGSLIGTQPSFPGYTLSASGDSVLIKLVAISRFGCVNDSMQHMFYSKMKPSPAFTVSDSAGCGPLTVSFSNLTPDPAFFSFKWNFGNGVTSSLAHPGNVIFLSNPNYTDTVYKVSLTVFSQCDSITIYKNILVRSKPKSIFNPDKTVGCSPMTVTFSNNSMGGNGIYFWDFGDGTTLTTTNQLPVEHVFNSTVLDTFIVKLSTQNICGSDTQQFAIVVSPNAIRLNLIINGSDANGCSPHSVTFINNSSGATAYNWDFGDGNVLTTTANLDTVVHLYSQPGTYIVKLKGSNLCSDSTTFKTINVYAKPVINFTFGPSPACIGDTIQFTNLTDSLNGLTWKFGDGNISSLTNPKYKYNAAGTYNVTLIGVKQYASGSVCIDSASKPITIISQLPGKFNVSDSVGKCLPFTVTFTNNNLPSAQTVWDFGDGKKDTGDVVIHTFTSAGTFKVQMIATHPGGCKYVDNHNIKVTAPSGSFAYVAGNVCGSVPVRFQATTSGVDSIRWNFGDGQTLTSTSNIVYHTYKQAGQYIPSVDMVAGATGSCHINSTGPDTIKVDIVKAGFKESFAKDCGKTTVSFIDTSSAFFGVVQCFWKFGDGSVSSVQNPVHTYASANTYMVQLITKSALGCLDTIIRPVTVSVYNKPIIAILSDTTACANQVVRYTSNVISRDSIASYSWTFSNGATGNGSSFNNTYFYSGHYNANLVVSTVYGCTDTVQRLIAVNPVPVVSTVEDKTICAGQSVQLNATGAGTYLWSPANSLSCAACANPVAKPLVNTIYEVAGTNTFGCTAKDSVTVSILQPFKIDVSASDSICVGESVQLLANGAEHYKWLPPIGLSNSNIANPIATPASSTRYRVVGTDDFKCFTDTAYVTIGVGKIPTVNLGPDRVLSAGTLLPLKPVITNGPITDWQWSPSKDLTCNNCGTPVATIKKDITYQVLATNAYGCTAQDTINIKVFCESTQVYIPNVFTPDNDGLNDVLMVRGTGIKTIKMFRVFNRWGELVFERSNFSPNEKSNGWDGTYRGVKAPPDVFVYTCEVLCENDNSYIYKGNVAIIK